MKPIIIYMDRKDEVRLTKEEFEKYIRDAYDQGYNCGYADGKKNYWTPYWYGNTITSANTNSPLTIDPYTSTKTTPTNPNITWTCSNTGTDNNVKFQAAKFDDTKVCINMGEVHNAKGD